MQQCSPSFARVRQGEAEDPAVKAIALKQCIHEAVKDWIAEGEEDMPPLKFWKARAKGGEMNRHILRLARHLLGIPGSNAILERAFSKSGRAVNSTRPRLDPTRATATIFMHENFSRGLLSQQSAESRLLRKVS